MCDAISYFVKFRYLHNHLYERLVLLTDVSLCIDIPEYDANYDIVNNIIINCF